MRQFRCGRNIREITLRKLAFVFDFELEALSTSHFLVIINGIAAIIVLYEADKFHVAAL